MAACLRPMKGIAITFIMLMLCLCAPAVKAQKHELFNNWVKIHNGQYGIVVGSNKKDSLYFVTVTPTKVSREELEIAIILPAGKASGKARLVSEFDFSRRNVALYLYVGSAARKTTREYYEGISPTEGEKYALMSEGEASADFKTKPFINKAHSAVFEEVVSAKQKVYYFNKTGVSLEPGMPLLNKAGKAIVGMVADHLGSKDDRFSVIDMSAIAERLKEADRNTCRYFNLLWTDFTKTPCEQAAIDRKLERERHIREDIERRNRTREQRRIVRRTSDYWLSAGPAASWNIYYLSNGENPLGGTGYSLGMNLYVNPNPKGIAFSIRPRYSYANLTMNENNAFGSSGQFLFQGIDIKSLEMPIVMETGAKGVYAGIGYVPVRLTSMTYSYSLSDEEVVHVEQIAHPEYIHRIHIELGGQWQSFRATLAYQYQFGTFMNRNNEMIVGSEVIKPFEGFGKRYNVISIELTYRLWSRWREPN